MNRIGPKKVSGTFCRNGPAGAAHKRYLTPFLAGVTLLELLVVIVLLSILAAVAIPTVTPAVEERQMREAARGLSTFLAGARARAMRNGRPVGVRFEPISATSNQASLEMFIVEVPPLYAGDTLGADAEFTAVNPTATPRTATLTMTGFNASLVMDGDLIRFNYQGPWWEIKDTSPFTAELLDGNIPWSIGDKAAYQIKRQPVPSSAAPYQMPGNAVVDLSQSGYSSTVFGEGPVTIMFSPNGGVSSVICTGLTTDVPTGTILLLVGKTESIGPNNLSDQTNFQVAIGHKTGQVVSDTVGFAADFQGATGR